MKPCSLLPFSKLSWPRVARGVAASAFLLLAACSVSVQSAEDAEGDALPATSSPVGSCAHADAKQAGPFSPPLREQLESWDRATEVVDVVVELHDAARSIPSDWFERSEAERESLKLRAEQELQPSREPILRAVQCAGGELQGALWSRGDLHLRLPANRAREVLLHPHVKSWHASDQLPPCGPIQFERKVCASTGECPPKLLARHSCEQLAGPAYTCFAEARSGDLYMRPDTLGFDDPEALLRQCTEDERARWSQAIYND